MSVVISIPICGQPQEMSTRALADLRWHVLDMQQAEQHLLPGAGGCARPILCHSLEGACRGFPSLQRIPHFGFFAKICILALQPPQREIPMWPVRLLLDRRGDAVPERDNSPRRAFYKWQSISSYIISLEPCFIDSGMRKPRPGRDGILWQSQPQPVQCTLVKQESGRHCSLTLGSLGFTILTPHYESQSISSELRPHWFFHLQAVLQVLYMVNDIWST